MKTACYATLLVILTLTMVSAQHRDTALRITNLSTPRSVTIDGKAISYYELHLTNLTADTIRLNTVSISFSKIMLNTLTGDALTKATSTPVLVPKGSAVVYLEVLVGTNRSLNHSIQYNRLHNGKPITGKASYSVQTSSIETKSLNAPLHEGTWAAIYEPSWKRGHRRVIFTKDGVDYIPGRYAIDFVRLDSIGRYATGHEDSIANWYGYNNAVRAVAGGTVVATRSDFAESPVVSIESPAGPTEGSGNYVAIEIGEGQIAFYEHLKPGSITVKPGQRVVEGEVIGAIGFTGHSTGPHLHFHIATKKLPLWADGIPYTFRNFTLIGRYPDFNIFGKSRWQDSTQRHITRELPGPNTVISFTK